MESQNIGWLILTILIGCCLAIIAFAWIRELLFYRRHNWDFDQDVKGSNFYWGESFHPSNMMTNSDRLKKGYPFAFLLMLIIGLCFIFGIGK